jgi:hypothetical protein
MNLQGYRETFYTFSGKTSDLTRQLAFAAIAIIWIFKSDVAGRFNLPAALVCPGVFVVLALIFDLAQYCAASIIWRRFYRAKEREGVSEEAEIQHDATLEVPIYSLFVIKVVCVIIAYAGILLFLLRVLDMPAK